jgi:hypothetical protein
MYRSLPGGFLAGLCAQLFLPGCSGAPASDTNEQGLVGVMSIQQAENLP